MANPTVVKPTPAMVSPYSVPGYRPPNMDVPTGPVLKTGSRRPASGYQANTPTKAPGGTVKTHTTPRGDIPAVKKRRAVHTVTPMRPLNKSGRVIIPNNGISLPNSNRV